MTLQKQTKTAALSLVGFFLLFSLASIQTVGSYSQGTIESAGVLDDTFGNKGMVITRLSDVSDVGKN